MKTDNNDKDKLERQVVFTPFPKIGRLKRGCVITEKIDGTNAAVYIVPLPVISDAPYTAIVNGYAIFAQSRSRFITPSDDNYGFAQWVSDNAPELVNLGEGTHFGEWWGSGIQRRYGILGKRFSLFNVGRWKNAELPVCCSVVPVLYEGDFSIAAVNTALEDLRTNGSRAAPGFLKPEGVIVYHTATRTLFKATLENDDKGKGVDENAA